MEFVLLGVLWIACVYGGYIVGKKKDSVIPFVILSAIWPGCGFLIVLFLALCMPRKQIRVVGPESVQKFDSGRNPHFYERTPSQLYFYWGDSYNGIAVDLPGKRVFLSSSGRGRWFRLNEIKHYQWGGAEISFITSDVNFPELIWHTNYFEEVDTVALDRALKAAGDFRSR